MRQLEPASDCSDGSFRVRLDRRPDIVQILEGDLLAILEVSLAAVKWGPWVDRAACVLLPVTLPL